jgi:hypothetical protein
MVGLSALTGTMKQKDDTWKTVNNKKGHLTQEKLEEKLTSMHKTKITIMIRVPTNVTAEFSAAEVHIATIRELSKQDTNIIVLDHSGTSQVNIHKSFGHDKYKEFFKPREKPFRNGSVQVSVAHHLLSEVTSFNKALLLPFLKKNKVFIFFQPEGGTGTLFTHRRPVRSTHRTRLASVNHRKDGKNNEGGHHRGRLQKVELHHSRSKHCIDGYPTTDQQPKIQSNKVHCTRSTSSGGPRINVSGNTRSPKRTRMYAHGRQN